MRSQRWRLELQADQPGAGLELLQRLLGGPGHAFRALEQVDHFVGPPVGAPNITLADMGPWTA